MGYIKTSFSIIVFKTYYRLTMGILFLVIALQDITTDLDRSQHKPNALPKFIAITTQQWLKWLEVVIKLIYVYTKQPTTNKKKQSCMQKQNV